MKTTKYTEFCQKVFGRIFKKQKEEELEKKTLLLEQANIQLEYSEYYSFVLMNTILSIIISSIVMSTIYLIFPNTNTLLLAFLIPCITGITIASVFLNLPNYYIKKRAENIDRFLPYAINFISSMAVAGISPAEIFQSLSAINVYGEIQTEAKRITKQIKIMGIDNVTALKNAIEITPSKKFKGFLQGMIGTIQSGSDLYNYLSTISEKYLEDDIIERKKHLELLSVVAETFVIAVIAFPIFLVIILSVLGFFGGSMNISILILYLFSFLILPIVYIGFYALIQSTATEQISKYIPSSKSKFTIKDFYERYKKEFIIESIVIIVVILLVLSIYLMSTQNYIKINGYIYFDIIFISFLFLIGPVSFYIYQKHKIKRKMQEKLPDFLIEVSDSLSSGMTTFEAIKVAEKGRYGYLNDEIKKMKSQLSWNVSLKDVFTSFSDRLKSGIIQRIVFTINEGLLMGGNTSKIFKAAAKEVYQVNQIEHQRKANMSVYMSVIILCFFVFLAIILILDKTIFSSFFDLQSKQIQQIGGILPYNSIKPIELKYALFSFVYMEGIGSGILAGFMMDGKLSSGVRYGVVLAIVSFVVFKLFF